MGEEEEEEEEEKKKFKQGQKGMKTELKYGIFVWIHDFCMDFGMFFVYKLLGYDC